MTETGDKIIKILSRSSHYVTSKELANIIGVSSKTIYRSINSLNKRYGESIIRSERGKGYYLHYDKYLMLSGKEKDIPDATRQSPLERRNEVLTALLFNSPASVDIDELFNKYFMSKELIVSDLQIIDKLLRSYNLTLCRNGNRITIVGSEQSIRQAINNALIRNNIMNDESIDDFGNSFKDFNNYDNRFLTAQIDLIQRSFNTSIPYPYNINIFSHLYVLMNRYRRGEVIQTVSFSQLTNEQKKLREDNPEIYKTSESVIGNIKDYINCQMIPEIECYYLFEYLISMRYKEDFVYDEVGSSDALRLVDFYLAGLSLKNSKSGVITLRNNLVSHVRPMINRLNNNILIVNKLLGDIKSEYGDLYNRLRSLSDSARKELNLPWKITDDEVGYLTLYFAEYYEETKKEHFVLIMCESGIGTSKLLYAKIHHSFPNLNIVGIISKMEYEHNVDNFSNVDIIVSTVPVKTLPQTRLILSSAMFTERDKKRLSDIL